MGAGFSISFAKESVGTSQRHGLGLGDLPEGCLALILSFLDPSDICRLASLNKAFYLASLSDFVWESKLPQNFPLLVKKLFNENPNNMLAKKDIYARLCQPNNLDGGTKEVWMEKSGGGICVSVCWKGLKITGIDDRRYWNHIPTDESRFHTIAYLRQTWWLEVEGEFEFEFPPGDYSLFFRVQLGRASKRLGWRVCNLEQVHGWNIKPVRFQLWTPNGQKVTSQCYLSEVGKWINYHVGDFVVDSANITPMKIKFSMSQIDCTHTKGGLSLDSVLICPKCDTNQLGLKVYG